MPAELTCPLCSAADPDCIACCGSGKLPVLNPDDLPPADPFREAVQAASEKVRKNCARDSADVWRKIPEIIAAEFAPLAERLARAEDELQTVTADRDRISVISESAEKVTVTLEAENRRLREACGYAIEDLQEGRAAIALTRLQAHVAHQQREPKP